MAGGTNPSSVRILYSPGRAATDWTELSCVFEGRLCWSTPPPPTRLPDDKCTLARNFAPSRRPNDSKITFRRPIYQLNSAHVPTIKSLGIQRATILQLHHRTIALRGSIELALGYHPPNAKGANEQRASQSRPQPSPCQPFATGNVGRDVLSSPKHKPLAKEMRPSNDIAPCADVVHSAVGNVIRRIYAHDGA